MNEHATTPASRRVTDDHNRVMRRLGSAGSAMTTRQGLAVVGGQGLLVVTGLITISTVAFFRPSPRVWMVVVGISIVMTCFLLLSLVLPWSRWAPRGTLAFPAAVSVAVAVMGLGGHGIGMSYTGLLVLCFAYIGLTQPARTTVYTMPVGVCVWIAANDGWMIRYTPRLVIAVMVWVCLGELLAQLMARQRHLAQQLVHAANTDALTGTANRRSLNIRLSTAAVGDTLVLCDLDHFKQLNDTQGHAAGDKALADFGLALQATLRVSDFSARYGGEEFVLLLPATTLEQAQTALDRLRRHWSLLQPQVTFSAGIATTRADRDPVRTLQSADKLLYQAKEQGRNRDCFETHSTNRA